MEEVTLGSGFNGTERIIAHETGLGVKEAALVTVVQKTESFFSDAFSHSTNLQSTTFKLQA